MSSNGEITSIPFGFNKYLRRCAKVLRRSGMSLTSSLLLKLERKLFEKERNPIVWLARGLSLCPVR